MKSAPPPDALTRVHDRPILFSAPMIRALHERRKTQTRRIVKAYFHHGHALANIRPVDGNEFLLERWPEAERAFSNFGRCARISCPYGAKGDRLWVRETTWQDSREPDRDRIYAATAEWFMDRKTGLSRCSFPNGEFSTRAESDANLATNKFWSKQPSIFMPRWASRFLLEITEIRVQRVQDISIADAMAEGIPQTFGEAVGLGLVSPDSPGHEWDNRTSIENYAMLWGVINGADSWASNPWVWAVSFQQLVIDAS